MASFLELEVGKIGLIQQDDEGNIIQIGLSKEQSEILQLFLASLSKESKLIKMPEIYNLVFKSSLCIKCKKL